MIQGAGGEENVGFEHLAVHRAFPLSPSPLKLKHRKHRACALILIQQSAYLNVSACPFVKCIGHCYAEELCVKSRLRELEEKTHWFLVRLGI